MGRLSKDLILTANPGPRANELQYATHKRRKRKRRHSEREEASVEQCSLLLRKKEQNKKSGINGKKNADNNK